MRASAWHPPRRGVRTVRACRCQYGARCRVPWLTRARSSTSERRSPAWPRRLLEPRRVSRNGAAIAALANGVRAAGALGTTPAGLTTAEAERRHRRGVDTSRASRRRDRELSVRPTREPNRTGLLRRVASVLVTRRRCTGPTRQAGTRGGPVGRASSSGFRVRLHGELTAAGFASQQTPYDAFWGSGSPSWQTPTAIRPRSWIYLIVLVVGRHLPRLWSVRRTYTNSVVDDAELGDHVPGDSWVVRGGSWRPYQLLNACGLAKTPTSGEGRAGPRSAPRNRTTAR